MAHRKQTPETLAASGVRENDQADRRVDREHSPTVEWPQDRLVATCRKNNRVRFEVRLKSFDSLRRVVFGQRDQTGLGTYRETGPTLVFAPQHLDPLIQLLLEAKQACIEEGELS